MPVRVHKIATHRQPDERERERDREGEKETCNSVVEGIKRIRKKKSSSI